MKWNVPADHPALTPRAAVTTITGYSAGRDAAAVRRDTGFSGTVIKLASNEGACGPFPGVVEAIDEQLRSAQRYPEAGGRSVCGALAKFHGVDADEVLLAGGACAVLAHLSSTFLEASDEVMFGHPTFHLYGLEALRMGAIPVPVALRADGSYDLAAMFKAITERTRIIYVCTPNNPTGGIVPRRELAQFLEELPARVLPIIDQAYFEYVEDSQYPDPMRIERPSTRPAVVVRTFSKIYGLAGLRVGYAIAPAGVIAACRRIQNPYEVGRVAQAAALASLAEPAELMRRRSRNSGERARLVAGLRALGLVSLPSHGNFLCVRVGDAKRIAQALEARGVIVRPLDAMGDPGSIRITVGTANEVDICLTALGEVLCDARTALSFRGGAP